MLGQWSLAVAVSTPVFLFTNLQLRVAQATDAEHKYHFWDYMSVRFPAVVLALLTIVVVATIGQFDSELFAVLMIYSFGKAFDWIGDICFGKLQREERMDIISRSMMLNGAFSFVAFILLLGFLNRLIPAAIAYSSVSLLVLFLYTVPKADIPSISLRGIQDLIRSRSSLRLLLLTLPLGFVSALSSLAGYMPQYQLQHHAGTAELGIFAAISYLSFAGQTVTGALGQAASPRLSRFYAGGDFNSFRRLLGRLLFIVILLAASILVVVLLVGRELITILYSPEYAQYETTFITLTIATGILFCASIFGYAVSSIREFRGQLIVHSINLPMTWTVSAVAVPIWGARGAAGSMLAGAFILCMGYGWILWRRMGGRDAMG